MVFRVLVVALVVFVVPATGVADGGESDAPESPGEATVGDELRDRELSVPENLAVSPETGLEQADVLDTHEELIVVGYVEGDFGGSESSRQVVAIRYDRDADRWTSRLLAVPHQGPIDRVERFDDRYAFRMRGSPSRAATIVLDDDLMLLDRLPGWIVTPPGEGPVVFRKNLVHTAPTHPVELYLYRPSQMEANIRIFPTLPGPDIRRQIIEQTEDAYERAGEDWCREQNHHCDAQRLDQRLSRRELVATNPEENAVAFLISYRPDPVDDPDQTTPVLYVYRNLSGADIEYRELSVDVPEDGFTNEWISQWVESDRLEQLFEEADEESIHEIVEP